MGDDLTNDGTPTLTGAAEANSSIQLTDGGPFLGQAVADGTGNWSFTIGGAGSAVQALGAGVHLVTTGGAGRWQYSTAGTTWTDLPAVAVKRALLLSADAKLRFVPSKNFSGTVTLTAHAWDGSGDFANGTANLAQTGHGGNTPFSARALQATCLLTKRNVA